MIKYQERNIPINELTQDFIDKWNDANDFIEVSTSGSTAVPKRIKISKEYMWKSASATCQFIGLDAKSKAVLALPSKYIGGMMMMVRAMYSGCKLYALKAEANPLKNFDANADFIALTPYQFSNCYNENYEKLSKIGTIILGGGRVSSLLVEKIKKMPNKVFETFGMTETISHIALKPIATSNYFLTLPNVDVSTNQEGRLIINAPEIGVVDMLTNDIVELKSNKEFKWVGRYDNVINTGGIKVYPEQIENEIKQYVAIDLLVTAIEDEKLGDKIILLIHKKDEDFIPELESAIEKLERYHRPKEIRLISDWVYTPTQKINRKESLKNII